VPDTPGGAPHPPTLHSGTPDADRRSGGSPGGGITVDRLTKRFGPVTAVHDVSLDVRPGEVVGLVGPNGAGKTTLVRMVLGLTRPDSGTVTVGSTTGGGRPGPAVGATLGPFAHPGRRGRTHLRAAAASRGLSDAVVDAALAEVDLANVARTPVRRWSLGMRHRLALAEALLGNPSILVLDEPTNGLDPDGIGWLRTRLRQAAADGAAVLISSHLLLELAQVADRTVLLDGRVLWQGTTAEAQAAGGLEAVYHAATGHRRSTPKEAR
jgi:ABC-2 type transport system ATP-binding protein